MWQNWQTLPGQEAYSKPPKPMTDKVSAASYRVVPCHSWETAPMNTTCQTAQEQRPANLTALHQTLKEMFARTKSVTERPVVVQGPVIVVRGK